MTSQRYNRAVSVTIANVKSGSFAVDGTNAIVITGLRVAFAIEKSLGKTPNTCSVSISNLSATTRGFLQKLPLHVTLAAGYGNDLRQLFAGDVLYTSTQRDGGTTSTKIQIGDGARSYSSARLVRSYKGVVSPMQIVADLAGSMNLSIPTSAAQAVAQFKSFSSGVSIAGPSAASIDKIVKRNGFDWSIQDGQVQVLAPGATRPGTAIVVSQDTGMIGSPEYGTPPADGKPAELTVKSLLIPEATPGAMIQIKSIGTNGFFRIQKVKHDGDNYGDDWTTSMECLAQ